jgi:hypothetical protein
MCDEGMRRVASRHDNAGSDRLLPQVVFKDLLLDALHNLAAEEANYRQVHARIHQPERIASRNHTIKGRQFFEPTTNNLNFRMGTKLLAKDVTEVLSADTTGSHGLYSERHRRLDCSRPGAPGSGG